MTYQQIKEELVTKQKRVTEKQLKKVVIRLFLFLFGFMLTLGIVTLNTLGAGVTIFLFISLFFTYIWVLDLYVDSERASKVINIISRLWFLTYVLFVVVFIVLKMYHFI